MSTNFPHYGIEQQFHDGKAILVEDANDIDAWWMRYSAAELNWIQVFIRRFKVILVILINT